MYDPNSLPPLSEEEEQAMAELGFKDETLYMARKYYKAMWGKVSPYSETGIAIQTWPGLWAHARAAEKDEGKQARIHDLQSRTEARKQRKEKSQQGPAWSTWSSNCTARNVWIEESNQEWRRRVALAKIEKAKWDTFVEEARLEYQRRKSIPAPARPDAG